MGLHNLILDNYYQHRICIDAVVPRLCDIENHGWELILVLKPHVRQWFIDNSIVYYFEPGYTVLEDFGIEVFNNVYLRFNDEDAMMLFKLTLM